MEERADKMLSDQARLEKQRQEIEAKIEQLNSNGRDTEERLKNIQELINKMGNLEGPDRANLRLSLRSQLRRLIKRLVVHQDKALIALFFRSGERRLLSIEAGEVIYDAYPKSK